MEANREEAERCVEIARKYIVEGNVEKAKKFLNKAQKLCPSQRARNLLDQMEDSDEKAKTANGSAHRDYFNSAFFDHYNERPEPRSRFHTSRSQPRFSHAASEDDASSSSSSSSANASYASDPSAETNAPQSKRGRSRSTDKNRTQPQRTTSSPQLGVDYTKEELEAVNRIRHCKDYYEILNVSKEFTEAELKKSYRKLALQFHPDKCRCPGATEAFKAIGNAYAVLSDKEKRERYDMYGSEPPPPSRRRNSGFYEYDYSRGFEGDFTPEEIFNMFFGGGFPTGQVYRRRGPGGTTYYYQHSADHGAERNDSGFGVALQLLPILVLLFLSLASQFFIGEPAYSMHRTNKYTVERHTSDLRVPYYVKQDFLKQYRGNVHRVEQQVEEDYISNLRMNCYRERSQKEALAWRARTYGDSQLWEKAQHLPTPNCDRLNDIYS